jgi:hypothetical protein
VSSPPSSSRLGSLLRAHVHPWEVTLLELNRSIQILGQSHCCHLDAARTISSNCDSSLNNKNRAEFFRKSIGGISVRRGTVRRTARLLVSVSQDQRCICPKTCHLDNAGWTVARTQLDTDGERGRRERIREVNMFVPPFLREGRG